MSRTQKRYLSTFKLPIPNALKAKLHSGDGTVKKRISVSINLEQNSIFGNVLKRNEMKSKLFGIAAALVKSRKYTLALVGAQFVYLGYKYIQGRKSIKSKDK